MRTDDGYAFDRDKISAHFAQCLTLFQNFQIVKHRVNAVIEQTEGL